MTRLFDPRRLGRLCCCLILALLPLPAARAASPATATVSDTVYRAEAISSREIIDAEKFRDGLSKVIDGTVQCLNASTWAKQ